MIAFRDNLPLVRLDDGRATAFEEGWLCQCLARAARRVGRRKWRLGADIARSVRLFLEKEFCEPSIDVENLSKTVCLVLESLGQGDISGSFRLSPPPTQIFLDEIVQASGEAGELLFFELLRQTVREAVPSSAEQVEVYSARSAIKDLQRTQRWSAQCALTLDEVISLLQHEITPLEGADLRIHLT